MGKALIGRRWQGTEGRGNSLKRGEGASCLGPYCRQAAKTVGEGLSESR